MVALTIDKAKNLHYHDVLAMNDEMNADGTCVRWRVNGKVKTWKTRPNKFMVPVKHGMYDYGYITERNYHLFHINGSCEYCGI